MKWCGIWAWWAKKVFKIYSTLLHFDVPEWERERERNPHIPIEMVNIKYMRQTDLNKIERIRSSLLYVNARKKTKTSRKMAIDRVREGERENGSTWNEHQQKHDNTQRKKERKLTQIEKEPIQLTQPNPNSLPCRLCCLFNLYIVLNRIDNWQQKGNNK